MQMLICSFVWFRFPFMLWPTDMVSTLKISISFNLNLSVAWINWTSGSESLNEGRSCSRSSFLFIWNYSSGSEVVFFTSGSGKPVKTQWVKYQRFTSWILVWRQQHASAERFFSFLFLFPHVFRSYPSHLSLISWLFFFIMIKEKCLGEASQVYLSGRFAADGFLHDTFWTRWQTDAELLKWDVAWCDWMCSGRLSFKEKRSVH